MQKSNVTVCSRERQCPIPEETAEDPSTQTHDDIFRGTNNSSKKILSLLWHFCVAFNTQMHITSEVNHAISTQDITFFINLHHVSTISIHTKCAFLSTAGKGCLELSLCQQAGQDSKWKIKSC